MHTDIALLSTIAVGLGLMTQNGQVLILAGALAGAYGPAGRRDGLGAGVVSF